MSNLTIYKASAGSGKTFTLAVEYISLLIRNPRAYLNILAVTFTNKATAEMKERILSTLYGIANRDKESDAYLDAIKNITQREEDEIRHKANLALTYILHDYNHFRVETIDSFFQTVMRNLARELNLTPNLNIELDTISVLNDAVDNMLANLTAQSVEMKGILDYIEERINANKRWKIANEIKEFGKNIFNELVMSYGDKLGTQMVGIDNSFSQSDFINQLRAQYAVIIKTAKEFYTDFINILTSNGFQSADLCRGNSIENFFRKLADGNFDEVNKNATIVNCLQSADGWTKKTEKNQSLKDLVIEQLFPLLQRTEQYRTSNLSHINTIVLTLQHLSKIMLLAAIKDEIKKANKEHNRFLLAETNDLLHRVVGNNDSSFVFEKIGTNIRNVMIDEFQDTSKMQWENFKMLLIEGLSQGADSLIVGDVKQSIYRWRNGDWRILNGLRDKFYQFPINEKTLRVNRRSETNIINFNNSVFTAAKDYLNNIYKEELGKDCDEIINAYNDVEQQSSHSGNNGYVKFTFVGNDTEKELKYKDNTCVKVGEEVKQLLADGVQMNDITILVRKKDHISELADYFAKELHIRIISNEAFRLDASIAICIMIDALRYLSDETDKISLLTLLYNYESEVLHKEVKMEELTLNDAANYIDFFIGQQKILKLLPLYELLERLFDIFQLSKITQQDAYLFSFFDGVMEYLKDNSSDINSFITYWDETLCCKTIPSGRVDGIQAFTIHKAKGLQFHTVIVPFCDWCLENETRNHLVWCAHEEKIFNQLEIVPITYCNKMIDSVYRDDYLNEQLQLWVDNLNLLYVAFTRAEKNLIIFGKDKDVKPSTNNVSVMLGSILEDKIDDNGVYEIGECMPSIVENDEHVHTNKFLQQPSKISIKMASYLHQVQFRQSNRSTDFMNENNEEVNTRSYISRGKLLHQLFSMIYSEKEIDAAIDQLSFDGVINKGEEDEIRNFTHQAFSSPEVKEWFNSDWDVLNERSIIWNEHGEVMNRRPDRVMVQGKEVVVVDFKFGKKDSKYNEQVRLYMNLLAKIGYQKIKGYLWYVTDGIVENIN